MKLNHYFIRIVFLLTASWLLCLQEGYAQTSEVRTKNGVKITISTNQGKVCEIPLAYLEQTIPGEGTISSGLFENDLRVARLLKRAFDQIPPRKYFKAKVGEPVTITFESTSKDTLMAQYTGRTLEPIPSFFDLGEYQNGSFTLYPYAYRGQGVRGILAPTIETNSTTGTQKYTRQVTFTFTRPAEQAWIFVPTYEVSACNPVVSNCTLIPLVNAYNMVLPFVVEGVLPEEAPILGTITEPQVPYLVLHDPPGDGSFTEFQTTETSCRSLETNFATDESNAYNANVKIGVKGSIGLIATIDYEVYAEIRGSGATGNVQIQSTSKQTCVTISKGFATSEAPDGSDVFIGYGMDMNYGLYRSIIADTKLCRARLDSALVYAVVPGTVRQFVYTREGIEADINALQRIIADTVKIRPTDRAKIKAINDAQNQIDVWRQVLQLNEANKSSSTAAALFENISFSGGAGPISRESSIEITDTKTITTENYIDGAAGVQGVVNIGGSGFSGGFEYKTQKRFGQTTAQSGTAAKNIRYTFRDDDPGDKFNVDVVRDPMYGTPVFKVKAGTTSSCPYEGGYQRDQPKLKHDGQTANTLTKQGIPVNTSATFKLDLCNESNESRTYNLKLNPQSNLNGAVVAAAGVALNGNDLGQTFTIPANSCVQDLILEVRRLSDASPLTYPNLEVFMYSPCDPDITSSVLASVFFGNATTGTKDLGDASLLSVFPNPTNSQLQVKLLSNNPIESYQLSDLTGKISRGSNQKSALQQIDLDLSTLPKGMYVLQVRAGERVYARKVMLQ